MPLLNCSADTCKYQKDFLCSARSIIVENENATESCETNCRTYTYSDSALTNSTHHATEEIEITCDAINCTHNINHKCNASLVEITDSNAVSSEETECSSFLIK